MLYRREGETTWKALKRNLTEPLFVWDTTSVPNGTYVVKIAVSDAPANPRGDALMAERESSTFDIDNSPPTISVLSATRTNGHTWSASRCATSTRPCSASSTRSTRTAGGRSIRRMGLPIRGWKSSS